ncbi:MAG: CopG family ribbon-helix-helix protein [Janthinobacterium lividum]
MPAAAKEAVTVRLDTAKRAEVDALAHVVSRDRSFLINEAIDAYLAVHRWQLAEVKEGLQQAEASEFATDAAFQRTSATRVAP